VARDYCGRSGTRGKELYCAHNQIIPDADLQPVPFLSLLRRRTWYLHPFHFGNRLFINGLACLGDRVIPRLTGRDSELACRRRRVRVHCPASNMIFPGEIGRVAVQDSVRTWSTGDALWRSLSAGAGFRGIDHPHAGPDPNRRRFDGGGAVRKICRQNNDYAGGKVSFGMNEQSTCAAQFHQDRLQELPRNLLSPGNLRHLRLTNHLADCVRPEA
jgi:hypothetical protein